MKKLLLSFCLIPTLLFSQTLPPLAIDQEKFLTDTKGSLQVNGIIRLKVGDSVSISLQDGSQYKGKIFQREEERGEYIKIYGVLNDDEKSGFGFVFTKEEGFNGALVLKKNNTDYAIILNKEDNSFYFIKTIKLPKTVKL
jgi:hypothetical protein